MKKKGIFFTIILIFVGGFTGVFFLLNQKKESKLDTTKYEGYTFTNIHTYDEKTNGKFVYDLDKIVDYSKETEIKVNLDCTSNITDGYHTYSIIDGKVIMKKKNGDSYTFKNIKNASHILIVPGLSCDSSSVVILTENHEVYIREYDAYATFLDDDTIIYPLNENDIQKINGNFEIEKIGTLEMDGIKTIVGKTVDGMIIDLSDLEEIDSYIFGYEDISIKKDATATFGDKNITDEKGNTLYISGVITSGNICSEKETSPHAYFLTRQGYLYVMDTCNSVSLKKYTDKLVKKIGTKDSGNERTIILFEDGKDLTLTYDYTNFENLNK